MTEKAAPASRVLADQLRADIAAGRWKPGEKVPSERQLAQEHQIARNTAREAIRILTQEGLVSPRHGSGIYVLPVGSGLEVKAYSAPLIGRPTVSLAGDVNPDLRIRSTTARHVDDIDELGAVGLQPSESGMVYAVDEIFDENGSRIAVVTSIARGDDLVGRDLRSTDGATELEAALRSEGDGSRTQMHLAAVRTTGRKGETGDARDDLSDIEWQISTRTLTRDDRLILATHLRADATIFAVEADLPSVGGVDTAYQMLRTALGQAPRTPPVLPDSDSPANHAYPDFNWSSLPIFVRWDSSSQNDDATPESTSESIV